MSDLATDPANRRIAPGAATICLGLFAARWLAGIVENAGAGALSENVALLALAGYALLFLTDMRIAGGAGLALAGLIGWTGAALLSAAANGDLANGDALQLIALLGFYGLFANACFLHLAAPRRARQTYSFLAAFIALGAALSVWQIWTGTGFVAPGKPDLMRAIGSDVHPVSFGLQIVAALAALEVARRKAAIAAGVLHLGLFTAGATALYLTYARTAWALAAITLLWPMLSGGSVRRRALALLAAAAGLAFAAGNGRFGDLGSLPGFLASFDPGNVVFDPRLIDNSISWRIVNWGYGLRQALETPVLGHGPGQSAAMSAFNLEMHNIALEVFFECGAFGLAALALLLRGLMRLHAALPRATATDRTCRRIAGGLGWGLFLAVMVSTSLVDQLMTVGLYLLLLALARGPAASAQVLAKERAPCDPDPDRQRDLGGAGADRNHRQNRPFRRPAAAGAGPAQSRA